MHIRTTCFFPNLRQHVMSLCFSSRTKNMKFQLTNCQVRQLYVIFQPTSWNKMGMADGHRTQLWIARKQFTPAVALGMLRCCGSPSCSHDQSSCWDVHGWRTTHGSPRNVILALYVCLNIALVVCILSGFLLNVMGYELGSPECLWWCKHGCFK